jgi:hypothetical protein
MQPFVAYATKGCIAAGTGLCFFAAPGFVVHNWARLVIVRFRGLAAVYEME